MKKYKILIIVGLVLMGIGFIIQEIEMCKILGFMILLAFVPHWSLVFYLGIFPLIVGILGVWIYEE